MLPHERPAPRHGHDYRGRSSFAICRISPCSFSNPHWPTLAGLALQLIDETDFDAYTTAFSVFPSVSPQLTCGGGTTLPEPSAPSLYRNLCFDSCMYSSFSFLRYQSAIPSHGFVFKQVSKKTEELPARLDSKRSNAARHLPSSTLANFLTSVRSNDCYLPCFLLSCKTRCTGRCLM